MRRRVMTIVMARLSQAPAVDAWLVTGTSPQRLMASAVVSTPI
ncbi:hypothetical protein ABZ348_31025 [Streptomyces sp. NPDC005963]